MPALIPQRAACAVASTAGHPHRQTMVGVEFDAHRDLPVSRTAAFSVRSRLEDGNDRTYHRRWHSFFCRVQSLQSLRWARQEVEEHRIGGLRAPSTLRRLHPPRPWTLQWKTGRFSVHIRRSPASKRRRGGGTSDSIGAKHHGDTETGCGDRLVSTPATIARQLTRT